MSEFPLFYLYQGNFDPGTIVKIFTFTKKCQTFTIKLAREKWTKAKDFYQSCIDLCLSPNMPEPLKPSIELIYYLSLYITSYQSL